MRRSRLLACGRHDQPRHHDDREIEERLAKLLAQD